MYKLVFTLVYLFTCLKVLQQNKECQKMFSLPRKNFVLDKNQHHQGVENEYNSYVSYHHGIICKQHQHPFLLFCHCYAPRGFFVCIDAISHLSTGDRNDKLRLRDRLTLLLCCNCICRKEVQHYGILVQSPTLSDFFCTWYFADVEFRPISEAFHKFCNISLHIYLQLNSIQFTNSTMVYLLWIPATYLFLLHTKLEIKC